MEQSIYNTMEFVAPSGFKYTIREENGADEEIISNQAAARKFMNITNFISAIIVKTDFTTSGKVTPEEALDIPLRDRYAILIASRIFSLGDTVDFAYIWPDVKGATHYEQDLNELILSDYENPDPEELASKPDAIQPYADAELLRTIRFKNYEYTLTTGKSIRFDLANGRMEKEVSQTPEDKQTRNLELLVRNLHLKVNDRWERVEQFALFSVKEMAEIRTIISKVDPIYSGLVDIYHPVTEEVAKFPIFQAPRFFFLTEA